MLKNYKLKCFLLLFLIINLTNSTYAQTGLGDSSCTKCEEEIRNAMQNWKKVIANHDDIAPISFVKLFKVDNEETKKLIVAKFTADTTFTAILYWNNYSEKIKLVRQDKCFGKKITTLMHGDITKAKYTTKKEEVEWMKNHVEQIAYCYEVIYKNKETTVAMPVLCFKAGFIIDAILSTSQFIN